MTLTPSTSPGPFIKWAGGKRKLLPILKAAEPQGFTRLIEPFIGGGAYFFSSPLQGKDCIINDVNPELVNLYKVVRDDVDGLIKALTELGKNTSEAEFLRIRALDPVKDYPSDPVGRAARVVYLNKTCFNGLWRENSKGKFNVPWGKRENVKLFEESLLRADSVRLQGTLVENLGVGELFNCLLGEVGTSGTAGDEFLRPGTLVYLDPPYVPLSPTSSFSQYSKNGFGVYDQIALAETIKAVTATGASVMLSNSDTPFTREVYALLDLLPVSAPRSIAASGTRRQPAGEVLGVSYQRNLMVDGSKFPSNTHPNLAKVGH